MILARLGRPLARLLPTPRAARRRRLCCGGSRRCWRWRPAACRRRDRLAAAFFRRSATKRGRVALLQGCAQQVLAPRINQAAINLLTRHGIEVVLVKDEQCCGALTHHLGRDDDALARARANISVWSKEAGARRPRRHPGDDLGLRHGHQGLRLHAARGPRFRRPGRAGFPRWPRTSPSMSPASSCSRRSNTATSSSPITPLVRCSTDRKSRKLRKNCFPRTDSW